MTKKDYILIAECFKTTITKTKERIIQDIPILKREIKEREIFEPLQDLFNEICFKLKEDNNNFDKNKFLIACNIQTIN